MRSLLPPYSTEIDSMNFPAEKDSNNVYRKLYIYGENSRQFDHTPGMILDGIAGDGSATELAPGAMSTNPLSLKVSADSPSRSAHLMLILLMSECWKRW